MTDPRVVPLLLDRSWWPLGGQDDPLGEVVEGLIDELVDPETVPATAIAGLRRGLTLVGEFSHRLAAGDRLSFALVRDPARGRVDALLSTRFSRIPPDTYDAYLAAARAQRSTDTIELINQRVIEAQVPAGRVIVVHDFTIAVADEGVRDPALERCTAGLFVDDEPALIELFIATQDLTLFDDLVAFALALLAGEDPGVPGYLEHDGSGER